MSINYDGRVFRAVSQSENGEVDEATEFHYHQRGDLVWAAYHGGAIRWGTLIALMDASGALDMRYQHVNTEGKIMTGTCHSVPERLDDGRLRLRERWRWTSGDESEGESIVEEARLD